MTLALAKLVNVVHRLKKKLVSNMKTTSDIEMTSKWETPLELKTT